MKCLAGILTLLLLLHPACLLAADELKSPLECRIRAVHKGGDDIIKLKITLENVGGPPMRVIMPSPWFNMSAGTEVGGWSFHFTGPDGKVAKLDWDGPPPSPKAFIPHKDHLVLISQGQSVGMTLPLKGQLSDPKKVSTLTVTYWMNHKVGEMRPFEGIEWYKELSPRLWEGKVQSNTFDIRRFVETRPKKR